MSISDGPMAVEIPLYERIKDGAKIAFMASAIGLSNPVGHDVIYQGVLRLWFAPEWFMASWHAGQPISFQNFRDNAEFMAYDPNPDVFMNNMRLLKGDFSFCIPFVNEEQDNNNRPANIEACHAAVTRNEKGTHKKFPKNGCGC